MIRIAAVGDVHFDRNSAGRLRGYLGHLEQLADFLLLAGDLTQIGSVEEAKVLSEDLQDCPVPVIAVLGNHDFHSDQQVQLVATLNEANVTVLEKNSTILQIKNQSVGIVGLKGFGGGFMGSCGTEFGEPEMKAFIRNTKIQAEHLQSELEHLQTDYKIVLLHYSPCPETLLGEKKEIYPFLGSYLFAEAIDRGGADIVFHGHAHHGVEKGLTPGGVPVRNVARPVIRHAFHVYCLNKEGQLHHDQLSLEHAKL